MATKEIICVECGLRFVVETGYRSGRTPLRCPACRLIHVRKVEREKQYRWRAKNPSAWKANQDRHNAKRQADPAFREQRWQRDVRKKYGAEPDAIQALIEAQGGVCAICGRPPGRIGPKGENGRLHLDHDHATGAIRGLLCGNCNTMIGLAGDDPEVLATAIAYLRKEKA